MNSISVATHSRTHLSPVSAVRSIVSSYSKNKNDIASPAPSKTNSRVRAERRFGEVITSGTLLQELREKANAKKKKLSKQAGAQQSQRSTKKKS